jgi:hypothetical protein
MRMSFSTTTRKVLQAWLSNPARQEAQRKEGGGDQQQSKKIDPERELSHVRVERAREGVVEALPSGKRRVSDEAERESHTEGNLP